MPSPAFTAPAPQTFSVNDQPQLQGPLIEEGQMSRGLRSAVISSGANEAATDYLRALQRGDKKGAGLHQARFEALSQEAQDSAPRVQSLGQVNNPGDLGDWAAGQLGAAPEALVKPVLGGLAAGAAGRMLGGPAAGALWGSLGGVGAMVPSMRDAAAAQRVQAFQGQPNPQQAGEMLNSSMGQGIMQSAPYLVAPELTAVPRMLGGKLMPKAPSFGGALARGTALQAGAGAASEGIGQSFQNDFDPTRDRSHDTQRMWDAAAGNALIAAPFEAAGHAGQQFHDAAGAGLDLGAQAASAAGKLALKATGKAGEAIKDAWDNRPENITDAAVQMGQGAADLHTAAEDAYTRFSQRGKDPHIDTLLKPQRGMKSDDIRADDTAKHQAAESFAAKVAAAPDEFPDFVQQAVAQYGQSSKMMDSWRPVADAVNDWKRTKDFGQAFKDFTSETGVKVGDTLGKAVNAAGDARDAYTVARGERNNAQRVGAPEDDGFMPLLGQALAPHLGFKTRIARERVMPMAAKALHDWIEGGFSNDTGKVAVPGALLKMFPNDTAKAISTATDLMFRQGKIDEQTASLLKPALKTLKTQQKTIDKVNKLIDDRALPTTLADPRFDRDALTTKMLSGKADAKDLEAFGPHAENVQQDLADMGLGEPPPKAEPEAVKATLEGLGTDELDPNVVEPRSEYHFYNDDAGEPYRKGAPINNIDKKTGEVTVVGDHDTHAANKSSELQARNSSAVKKVGFVDYLRDMYGDDREAFGKHLMHFIGDKESELAKIPGKGDMAEKANDNWYVLREDHQGVHGESTNVDPAELRVLAPKSRANVWAEHGYNSERQPLAGRIWLQRKNADGTLTEFATSPQRIIKNMSERRKRDGRADQHTGLAGQRSMLEQGLASLLTSADKDGASALTGKVGVTENGRVRWLKEGESLPEDMPLYSKGMTVRDAKDAAKAKQYDETMQAGRDLVPKIKDETRQAELQKALDVHDVRKVEKIVRDRELATDPLKNEVGGDEGVVSTLDGMYKGARSVGEDVRDPEAARTHNDETSAGKDSVLHDDKDVAKEAAALKAEREGSPVKVATREELSALIAARPDHGVRSASPMQARMIRTAGEALQGLFGKEIGNVKFAVMEGPLAATGRHYGKQGVIALHPDVFREGNRDLQETPAQRVLRVVAHELAHNRDKGESYRSNDTPALNPGGKIYDEAKASMRKSLVLRKQFGYIMDGSKTAEQIPRELFAQLHALYVSKPELMNEHLPQAYRAIERNHQANGARVDAAQPLRNAGGRTALGEAPTPGSKQGDAGRGSRRPDVNDGTVNVWHGTGENAELSNLAARPFTFNGRQYKSVEHAYQSLKSGEFDQATYDKYKTAGVKIAGKQADTRNGANIKLMEKLMHESFAQNPGAAKALRATGTATITHTQDKGVWAKEFPRILEKVRSELLDDKGTRNNAQSTQPPGKTEATSEDQAAFHKDIERRFGGSVSSELSKALTGKNAAGKTIPVSGQWTAGAIKASVFARNLGQVGAHESFHEFFNRLRQVPEAAKVMDILDKAANSPYVKRQLERLLDGEREALKQIGKNDPHAAEERMAYMFQFHQAGILKVGPETEGTFAKIARFFRKVTGLLNDDQKADMIMKMFDQGKMPDGDAAAKVLANSIEAHENMAKSVNGALKPMMDRVSRIVNTAETNMRRNGYDDIRRMFKRSVGEDGAQGFLDAKDHQMKMWSNKLAGVFDGLNPKDLELAAQYLHSGKKATDPVVRDIVSKLQGKDGILPAMEKYLREAGVKRWDEDALRADGKKGDWVDMGHVDNYFPRSFDTATILKDPSQFVKDMLQYNPKQLEQVAKDFNDSLTTAKAAGTEIKTAEDVAKAMANRLINGFGQASLAENNSSVGFSPFMQAVNKRDIGWLHPDLMAKYGNKDVSSVMTSYIAQGIKRAEYVRRFGNGGEVIKSKLEDVYKANVAKFEASGMAKADAEQKALKLGEAAAKDVMAMEGTLGWNINPTLRKINNSMLVYENLRTLSTSLFSQFIDPLGLVVRGATMGEAWSSYKRGLREVMASIKGDGHIKDKDSHIADMVGTTDAGGMLAAFGQLYSSQYMGAGFRKANDMLFKYNGMEGFNRGMQVSATRSAINFIKRHVQEPNERSKDYLAELNLKAKDVKIDKNGDLNYTDPRIQEAIHQWVNGAIMRPNAAQRPAWGSDPHYMAFWHMKQFAYTFHDVIMKRAIHDVKKYGDMGPAGVLAAAFAPIMIASDALKSVLLTGDEPGWMKAGLGAEIQHGVMRAGLMGKFQPAADTLMPGRSILGLGGPVVEQIGQMFTEPENAVRNAMPGANLLNMWSGHAHVEVQGED